MTLYHEEANTDIRVHCRLAVRRRDLHAARSSGRPLVPFGDRRRLYYCRNQFLHRNLLRQRGYTADSSRKHPNAHTTHTRFVKHGKFLKQQHWHKQQQRKSVKHQPATAPTKVIYQYLPAPNSPAITVSTNTGITEAELTAKLAALQSQMNAIAGQPPLT